MGEKDYKKDLPVGDTLNRGGTNTVIDVADTPIKVEVVSGTPKGDRKSVVVVPRAKGVYWGFISDVDTTDGPKGGFPLGKNQPLIIAAESNTPVYLVGPSAGVKVAIGEA
jgi:hypothetical protein